MKIGIIGRILKQHSSQARARGRILRNFAKKLSLVYFGSVDQHVDEHAIIRGLTVSTTHRDDHYAVGGFDGYDVSLVDRFDVLATPGEKSIQHSWVILQLDLQSEEPVPHFFLQPVNHTVEVFANFFNAYKQLKRINDQFITQHSSEFHSRYEVFASPSQALEIESFLTSIITQQIAVRLWPHAVEVFEGKLYVYATQEDLSEAVLESSLESALWLARALDKVEEN